MGDGKLINKSAIKNFSIEARNILIKSAITEAGFYGISKDEISKPIQKGTDFEVYKTAAGTEKRIFGSDIKRRANLVKAINEKGFDEVIEETAYTWFNRLIAIRFMEVNDYLPSRVRVLSSETGSGTPDLVTQFLDVDLNMSAKEIERVQKAKSDNQYDEAFRLLFIKSCNELNDLLPGLFEKTDDYKELLLNLPYTSNGVVRMLVDTIPESNFNVNEGGQVEIIGWLYQYYNTEPKAKAFAKKGKITKEEIPAVTQLFTPDWIVRYMVENSLGRLWIEHLLANGDSRSEQEIANDFGWKYYLPEAEQEPEVQAKLVQIRTERKDLTPEDILCIDPCQGSGHILVYLYDVLMQIYREDGYSERDAARSILEHNLYGLDIDDRAYQLSYFAVLMKARQYDRVILKKHIKPHVYSIQESNIVNRVHLKYLGADMSEAEKKTATKQLTRLLDTFKDAKEYGSILNVDSCDWDLLRRFVVNDMGQFEFEALGIDKTQAQILPLIDIGEVMAQKYHVVTTNPPYLSEMNKKLQAYTKKYYPLSKNDLCTVFIEKCCDLCRNMYYVGMITQNAFMFLSRYEKMRRELLNRNFVNTIHLGSRAFDAIGGEVVQTVTFIIRNNSISNYICQYKRLVDYSSEAGKKGAFLSQDNSFYCPNERFDKIPRAPMTYWVPDEALEIFKEARLDEHADPRVGMFTTDNDKYLREWWEPSYLDIGFSFSEKEEAYASEYKWFPYNKGGGFRRWYGIVDLVVYWYHGGEEIRNVVINKYPYLKGNYDFVLKTGNPYCKPGITWSGLTSGSNSFRLCGDGFFFDTNKGAMLFEKDISLYYLLALLNSKVAQYAINLLNSTISLQISDVASIPVIYDKSKADIIETLARDNVNICKHDWDAAEISWDYARDPLVSTALNVCPSKQKSIEKVFDIWKQTTKDNFEKLRENERTLNNVFTQMYRLEDEIDNEPVEQEISVSIANKKQCIKNMVSYAVGCMFGRYSLDMDGLAYAGGDWKEASSKYETFLPDEDAIIPITDEEYFKDDIVARFVEFIRIVYGQETLENNLKFIADALGNKGDTPRAVIRNYFLNDFYKDHCNTYSATGSGKRPIYWLFDSGKQNGFKALIYIHRYTPDTVGLIRSVYLHNAQEAIQNSLKNAEYVIATTSSAVDRAANTRKRDKYIKQLNELRPYYQAISHVALQRIEMDLDDGVKKNYQLFQGIEVSSEGKKKQTIDLLAKI